jgi:hypothetical protein
MKDNGREMPCQHLGLWEDGRGILDVYQLGHVFPGGASSDESLDPRNIKEASGTASRSI